MITHYQITLLPEHETRIFPEWGYHLYSSLLSLTPHGFGERMHSDGITPLSSCITVQDKQVIWLACKSPRRGQRSCTGSNH